MSLVGGCQCSVCFEETSPKPFKVISSDIESQIQASGYSKFSLDNTGLPNNICDSCRMKLDRLSKNPEFIPKSLKMVVIQYAGGIVNLLIFTEKKTFLPCPSTMQLYQLHAQAPIISFHGDLSLRLGWPTTTPSVSRQCRVIWRSNSSWRHLSKSSIMLRKAAGLEEPT